MKRWIAVLLMVFFAAGISVAEETASENEGRQAKREKRMERHRPRFSEKQRAEMKARYEKIQKLAEAARSEDDPAKKAELTEELRAALTEGAQKMQARFRNRVEKAEKDIEQMKQRLQKGEAEIKQRVEEKLQKILAGEHPGRRGGPEKDRRKNDPKPVE